MNDPYRPLAVDLAFSLVHDEFIRATRKFPKFNSAHEGYAVILEKLDELWNEVKANHRPEAVKEAVQVAAMAVRFILDAGETPE